MKNMVLPLAWLRCCLLALMCALLWPLAGSVPAMIAGAALTMILRLLAARFRWSLPKAK